MITTSSHENLHGCLHASRAKLVNFIGARNVPKKKVVNYNGTHILCPVPFFVILEIFEKFKQERAYVLKLLGVKDAFPLFYSSLDRISEHNLMAGRIPGVHSALGLIMNTILFCHCRSKFWNFSTV